MSDDWIDLQDCLDLIEARKPPGLLALLDEQCMLAAATDDQYANKLYKDFKEHGRFSSSNKQKAAFQFSIRHYAGEVVYTTDGFIDKNRDAIHQEVLDLLAAST
jgi:myosin-5